MLLWFILILVVQIKGLELGDINLTTSIPNNSSDFLLANLETEQENVTFSLDLISANYIQSQIQNFTLISGQLDQNNETSCILGNFRLSRGFYLSLEVCPYNLTSQIISSAYPNYWIHPVALRWTFLINKRNCLDSLFLVRIKGGLYTGVQFQYFISPQLSNWEVNDLRISIDQSNMKIIPLLFGQSTHWQRTFNMYMLYPCADYWCHGSNILTCSKTEYKNHSCSSKPNESRYSSTESTPDISTLIIIMLSVTLLVGVICSVVLIKKAYSSKIDTESHIELITPT
uniref:Uncharacterized protein n=1 Tax=Marseillevirus LCMAC201 TaxID=2506605 RepID=A0A481YW29_9VIRU|nr:MAG: hypothetical protein LCMAC201_02190 [Marseillevirus LCMAC201]